MSVKITFRNNLPPLIRRSLPSTENGYLKGIPKPLPKKGKAIHNQENNKDKVEEVLKELHDMIGLNMVKKFIHELQAFVEIQKKRERKRV